MSDKLICLFLFSSPSVSVALSRETRPQRCLPNALGSLYLCSEIINIPPYTTVHNCKKLNAVIPDETWQALEEIAKKEQRTKSQMAAILLGEALMLKMDRNYEAQQSQLQEFQRQTQEFQRQNQEFQRTTGAALERIDRVLDYLLRQSGQN